jgi:toxin ParE1/3/4
MRVRYTRRALGDIASIYSYIAVDNPKAARAVESLIRQTAELLADYPHLGVQTKHSSEFRGIKAGRYPYRIYYRIRGDEIWIVHIRHLARRPWQEGRNDG